MKCHLLNSFFVIRSRASNRHSYFVNPQLWVVWYCDFLSIERSTKRRIWLYHGRPLTNYEIAPAGVESRFHVDFFHPAHFFGSPTALRSGIPSVSKSQRVWLQ